MDGNENFYNEEIPLKSTISAFWSEKVFVVTRDYFIKGYVFMPKTGKKNRVLSDILNSEKRFVAIKNAEISDKRNISASAEKYDFIEINLDSIVLIRPVKED